MTDPFTGTGVALVTPFHSDRSVDFEALGGMVNHVIEGGVEYIVALGTTGESVTLSKEEKKKVVEHIIQSTNKRVPVVMGISSNDTYQLLETIKQTDLSGIAAILSVAPYYNKPSQKGLCEHFSAVSQVSPVPVILYNVPGRTSSNINADTAVWLASNHKNIIGIKEASGNLMQIMQIIKNKPDHFHVISGDDSFTLPMVHLGGSGVISVVANSHPRHYSDMVRAALTGDCKKANELHYLLLDYISALFEEGSPAGIKSALEIMGLCEKTVRLPLVSASDSLTEKLRKMIEEIG